MQVRQADSTDRGALLDLDPLARNDAARVRLIERIVKAESCLVAERSSQVLGYVGLEYNFFECGFIPILYVAEPERRRGMGRSLMEAVALRCRTEKLFVSTNQSNHPMQQLLESLGYVPSGVIHNLDPGDPELFYCLDLGSGAG